MRDQLILDFMTLKFLSNFKFIFILLREYFTKVKQIVIAFNLTRRKHGQKVFYKSKKRICTTVTSHVNSSKSNDMNKYNTDNFTGNPNIPHTNVHTEQSSNELVIFHK